MRLEFNEITRVPQEFSTQDGEWFSWPEGFRDGSLCIEYRVVRTSKEDVQLSGVVTGHSLAACDCCGEDTNISLENAFSYTLTTKKEEISELPEAEFMMDDLMTVYLEEPVIDVEELLHEQAELALPMRVVCQEGCQGICPGCGALLNREECRCTPDYSSSPFAVLKKLSQR